RETRNFSSAPVLYINITAGIKPDQTGSVWSGWTYRVRLIRPDKTTVLIAPVSPFIFLLTVH
ncbi:MAG: hypothetical protein AB1404_04130, partial [Spirochaetota bacterium]